MRIERFTQPGPGSVNSFVVDGGGSTLIVDGQRILSAGSEVAALARSMGQPVEAIVLTHPHPDHFGGLAALREAFPDAPLLMSAETAAELEHDSRGYFAMTREAFPTDSAETLPRPDRLIGDGDVVRIGATSFAVRGWRSGESLASVTLHDGASGTLIAADLVLNGMTPFLMEGQSSAWLDQLAVLEADYPPDVMAYPGHGAPASLAALIAFTRDYISTLAGLVRERLSPAGMLSPQARAEIVTRIEARHPGFLPVAEIPDLIGRNVDAVASELAGR